MREYARQDKSKKTSIKDDIVKTEITEESSAEVKTTGPETKNGIVVNCLFVKVRREPWTDDNNVLEVLNKGDKVTILGMVDGFYKVSTRVNKVAYISSTFIKEE